MNSVCFSATPAAAGRLCVALASFSPNFDRYELVDNGEAVRLENFNEYLWRLDAGPNALEMHVVEPARQSRPGKPIGGGLGSREMTFSFPSTEDGPTAMTLELRRQRDDAAGLAVCRGEWRIGNTE